MLLAVLTGCAVSDIREHRIPNGYIGFGIAAGLALMYPDPLAMAGFMVRMIFAYILGFPFFVLRMAGAGDIKVMGLITAFLGTQDAIPAMAAGLCLGAVLALGRMLRQGSIYQRFSYLSAYIRRLIQTKKIEAYYDPKRDGYDHVIPLGACLWAGVLLTVLWRG